MDMKTKNCILFNAHNAQVTNYLMSFIEAKIAQLKYARWGNFNIVIKRI